jgi:lipopolysaccharide transport system permease protein
MESAPPIPLSAAHRSLVLELARREITGRYRGATLGSLWSLLTPFLMLAVYTLAFGYVLKSRWPGAESTGDFALILFVGLCVHGFYAECFARAPTLVVGNTSYVKRIVFPLELLPWPVLGAAVFHLLLNLGVLGIALLATGHALHATALLVPAVVLLMLPFALGGMWFLAALGVYFRDVQQLVPPALTAMLFLSSAVIPVSAIPEAYRTIFQLNPLTPLIDAMRELLLHGGLPDLARLGWGVLAALLFATAGYAFFRRLRPGFADVL